MQSRKIDSYIGFALRAGEVIFGLDALLATKKTPFLVLFDAGTGEAGKRKLKNFAAGRGLRTIECKSGYIASAVHRDNVKIISLTGKSLADAILNCDESGIITEVESE